MKNFIGFIAIIIFSGLAVLSFGQTFGNGLAGCLTNPGNNGTEYPKDAQTDITVDGLGGYYAAVEDCAIFHISNNGTVDTVATDENYTQIDRQGSINFYGYSKATTNIDQFTDDGSGGYTITPLITTNNSGVKDISIRNDGSVDWIRADGTFTNSVTGDFQLVDPASDAVFTLDYFGLGPATVIISDQSADVYRIDHSTNTLTQVGPPLPAIPKNVSFRYNAVSSATNITVSLENNAVVTLFEGNQWVTVGAVSPGSHSFAIDPYVGNTGYYADENFVMPTALESVESVLPIQYLENLNAKRKNGTTILTWKTAKETNSDFFALERKRKGQVYFREIDRVKAAGESSLPRSYTMVDETVPQNGKYEYRLRQVDLDGQFEYSNLITFTVDDLGIKLFPNPAHSYLHINGQGVKSVFIFDCSGQIIKKFYSDAVNKNIQLDVTDITPGVYTARLETVYNIIQRNVVVMR